MDKRSKLLRETRVFLLAPSCESTMALYCAQKRILQRPSTIASSWPLGLTFVTCKFYECTVRRCSFGKDRSCFWRVRSCEPRCLRRRPCFLCLIEQQTRAGQLGTVSKKYDKLRPFKGTWTFADSYLFDCHGQDDSAKSEKKNAPTWRPCSGLQKTALCIELTILLLAFSSRVLVRFKWSLSAGGYYARRKKNRYDLWVKNRCVSFTILF